MTEQEAIKALKGHKEIIDKEYIKTRNSKAIEVVLNTLKEKDKIIEKLREDNYISIQKVKDKMQKDIKANEDITFRGRRNGKTLEYGKRLGRIEMCQELLESEE